MNTCLTELSSKIERGGVLRGKAQQCAIQDNPRLCASCVYSNANTVKRRKVPISAFNHLKE